MCEYDMCEYDSKHSNRSNRMDETRKMNSNSRAGNDRRRTSLLTAVLIGVVGGMIISYAASMFFDKSETQTSNYRFKHIFKMNVNSFFTADGDFTPGKSMSINPIVTLDATMDGYIVIVVEMPKYNRAGLYEIGSETGDSPDDWTKIEEWSAGDSWFEAYRYDDILSAGAATKPLGTKITMRTMSNADYGRQYADSDNLNINMTAYGCGSDQGESLESVWGTIKSHFGLGQS